LKTTIVFFKHSRNGQANTLDPYQPLWEEDEEHAGHKVCMEDDDNSLLIVCNPKGILGL
jgi:hypothetical protein